MILALDTSGTLFSIALLNEGNIEQRIFDANKQNSEKIIIEIQNLLKSLNFSLEDLKGIAFGSGPGTFSGVRVACGIAYGIAYAKKLPIIGIDTLEALAAIHPKNNSISCIDARMNQIYLGFFKGSNNKLIRQREYGVYDPTELPESCLDNPIIIGSGVKMYINELRKRYDKLSPAYDQKSYGLAGVIAKLSQNRFDQGFGLSKASPIYIRNKVAQTIIERAGAK